MTQLQPVLIVDDEPRNLRILEEILEDEAHLIAATNGEEALTLAETNVPDLVLLDIMMPGLDGYEVCERMRAIPALKNTRILLVSGKAMVEERLQGYQVGADDYITKPFVPDELLAKVKVFLKLAQAERSLYNLNCELEEKVRLRTKQMLRLERSAFLGAHAAEIVHNLKNPLAVVMGNLHYLKKKYPDEKRIETIDTALSRLNTIVRSILSVGKMENSDPESVDLNAVIKQEIELLNTSKFFKYDIKTNLQLAPLPTIKGQMAHFAQCLGNLIGNAADAMHGCSKKELTIQSATTPTQIEIRITDTGKGIPEENLQKIFDPFFTTKPFEGNEDEPMGTGLGLASVKRMLTAYHGSLEFASKVGEGTTATITIPLRPELIVTAQNQVPPSKAIDRQQPKTSSKPVIQDSIVKKQEEQRLEALQRYKILDTPREKLFDDLALVAATICQTPISSISLVDKHRQWFKAGIGIDIKETTRDIAICAHTVREKRPIIVEDTLQDHRFRDHPMVTGEPHIRFYAGVPLVDSQGHAIGTVCVTDKQPRSLSDQQLGGLEAIARQTMAQIEWQHNASQLVTMERSMILGELYHEMHETMDTQLTQAAQNLTKLQGELGTTFSEIQNSLTNAEDVQEAIGRTSQAIENILSFSRELPQPAYHLEDLKRCAEEAAFFADPIAKRYEISLSLSFQAQTTLIYGNRQELCHLLYELMRFNITQCIKHNYSAFTIDIKENDHSYLISSSLENTRESKPSPVGHHNSNNEDLETRQQTALAAMRIITANHDGNVSTNNGNHLQITLSKRPKAREHSQIA